MCILLEINFPNIFMEFPKNNKSDGKHAFILFSKLSITIIYIVGVLVQFMGFS